MRQLEVIAVSDDGTFVLLAGSEDAARPTHQLRIDSRLTAAINGDLDDSEPRESELSPKEIQARVRAGDSVEQVAKAANVALSRVMRYAGPVISERDRVVDQARAHPLRRPRNPEASIPLGTMVTKRLAETAGLRPETVAWDARRRTDGNWLITLTYSARGGARRAQWLWQPADRDLTSMNPLGTRLGAEETPRPARRRPAAGKRTVKRPAAKRVSAKRAAPRKAAPKRAAPKRAAPKKAAKRAAPKRAAPKRAAPKRAAPKRAAAKRAAPTRVVARRAAPVRRPRPAAPTRTPEPVVEPTTTRSNGRVPIPSWDDVLLGVQRPASRGRRRS
jgi:hypothetical protein